MEISELDISEESEIFATKSAEFNRNSSLITYANECLNMLNNRPSHREAIERLQTLKYTGESINDHKFKRLNENSSITDYKIATESFISKVIDTSTKVIKTIVDTILSAIRKFIEWISSLFGSGSNSNESKNNKVIEEMKEAKDKKEDNSQNANRPSTPTPRDTPIKSLVDSNKLGLVPDEHAPYGCYHLFNHMFTGKEYIADPTSILPYFTVDGNYKWETDQTMVANYPRICLNMIKTANYFYKVATPDDFSRLPTYIRNAYGKNDGGISIALKMIDNNDYENFMKSYDFKRRYSFDSKIPVFDYLEHVFRNDSDNNCSIIVPSLGINYIRFDVEALIKVLDLKVPFTGIPNDYLSSENENRDSSECAEKFTKRFWNNDFSKLDDLIKNNYEEAENIAKKSIDNIAKIIDRHKELSKKMPEYKIIEDLNKSYSASNNYEENQRRGTAAIMCIGLVLASIKQQRNELMAATSVATQARSLGRYIANRRIQMNTEADS